MTDADLARWEVYAQALEAPTPREIVLRHRVLALIAEVRRLRKECAAYQRDAAVAIGALLDEIDR